MDPLSFVRYLGTLGEIVHLAPVFGQLPEREAFDPEECRLGLEIELDTQADRQTLEDVFEFVRDGSQIRLIPPHSKVEDYIQLIRELPEEDRFLGEILVAGRCLTTRELEDALRVQKEESLEQGSIHGPHARHHPGPGEQRCPRRWWPPPWRSRRSSRTARPRSSRW